MGRKRVLKIYPAPEELSSVCSKVKCTEVNCKAIFQSSSNLNMHLIKHHKIANNALTIQKNERQYFCPTYDCSYHKDAKKHFAKLKYLKQHYLKVHASKEFICEKCNKKFSTETFQILHMRSCGKIFTCICGSYYASSEALLTHCKRKGKEHKPIKRIEKELKIKEILQDYEQNNINQHNSSNQANISLNSNLSLEKNNIKTTERLIYPKPSSDMPFSIHYIAAIALSELAMSCYLSKLADKGVQTEIFDFNLLKDQQYSSIAANKFEKKKSSQETQTISGKNKNMKISTETQTNSEYLKQKSKANFKTLLKKRKKSMETQTKDNLKKEESSKKSIINNTNKKINLLETIKLNGEVLKTDEERAKKWLWDNQFFNQKETTQTLTEQTIKKKKMLVNMDAELNLCSKETSLNEYSSISSKNSSSQYEPEQGSDNQIFDFNKLCNIETQTEIDTFLIQCNEDTNFTLCSTTETQTTDDFDSLLYSNMCTQTCEEVDQLFNFNFVHIETQTAWPDLNNCHDLNSQV